MIGVSGVDIFVSLRETTLHRHLPLRGGGLRRCTVSRILLIFAAGRGVLIDVQYGRTCLILNIMLFTSAL